MVPRVEVTSDGPGAADACDGHASLEVAGHAFVAELARGPDFGSVVTEDHELLHIAEVVRLRSGGAERLPVHRVKRPELLRVRAARERDSVRRFGAGVEIGQSP